MFIPGERECRKCLNVKPLDQFKLDSRSGRPTRKCKACHYAHCRRNLADEKQANPEHVKRRNQLGCRRNKYGITNDQIVELERRCGGLCEICGNPEPDKRRTSLHIDHDHATGIVRGMICSMCNRGLGLFRDNPSSLRRAADYLESSAQVQSGLVGDAALNAKELQR